MDRGPEVRNTWSDLMIRVVTPNRTYAGNILGQIEEGGVKQGNVFVHKIAALDMAAADFGVVRVVERLDIETRVWNRSPAIATRRAELPQLGRVRHVAAEPAGHANDRDRDRRGRAAPLWGWSCRAVGRGRLIQTSHSLLASREQRELC